MAEQSATDRTLCLVSGYHAVSFPPADVYELGLRFRFAVVLHTYRRDKADMYFDAVLFLRLVPALMQSIGYDQVDIRMIDGCHFLAVDDLARSYAGQEEIEQEPPARIELRKRGLIRGIVETEFWTMVGGPSPYHDSYALSFYTDRDYSAELRHISETLCSDVGAVITGFHSEQPTKEPYRPWRRKLLNWFACTRNRAG